MEDEHYFEVYRKYLARTTEHLQAIEWVHVHADELDLRQAQTVLSIGGGSGVFDLPILPCFPSLDKFVVVDPSAFMIEAFKRELQCKQQEHKLNGGMLKDRNLENAFVFECGKFEETSVSRFAELLCTSQESSGQESVDMTHVQACLPLFDLAIMSHCLYYMDPEAAVLQAGLIARKLLIFHDDESCTLKIIDKFAWEENEKVLSCANIRQMLEELATRPRPQPSQANITQRTIANFINNQSALGDWVQVDHVDAWKLPFTFDATNIDDDTIDFLLHKTAKSEERERLRQFLQRESADGHFSGSTSVFVVTFDGQ